MSASSVSSVTVISVMVFLASSRISASSSAFFALAYAAVLAAVLETVLVHVQLPLFLLIITHFNDYMFKTYKI